jgi:sigma-B regulation protein RsbU (phosphoserine phosphatase)
LEHGDCAVVTATRQMYGGIMVPHAVHGLFSFMTAAPGMSGLLPGTGFHLASLLDLGSRISGNESATILNAAILSVMGRLRITRACVLQLDGNEFVAQPLLCKGVPALRLPAFTVEEVQWCSPTQPEHAVLLQHGLVRLVPLATSRGLVAVLALGSMIQPPQDEESVLAYLELVGLLVGTAVRNAEMVQSLVATQKELEARNLLVTSLFEGARDFTGAKSSQELLRILSYHLMGQLMVSTFGIFLSNPFEGASVIVNRREAENLAVLHPDVLSITEPLLVHQMEPGTMRDRLEAAGVGMLAPMTVHGVHHGVLATGNKLNARPFTVDELSFLEAMGNAAIAAIENGRLQQEELEKRRLESELSIAAGIQRGLLPIELPPINGLDVAADSRTSRQIGGDYYDVIRLDAHRTLFAMADVAGKGIPAALLMANVQAALNVLARMDQPLTILVERINTLVFENTEADVFITMFLCVVNAETMGFEYVNAGHNPPLLVHGSSAELLRTGGVLVGAFPEPPAYETGAGTLHAGDVLMLYTDGVTEARKGLVEYGLPALTDVVLKHRDATSREILNAVFQDVRRFTDTDTLIDDTSMLVIKVPGG